ncbi:MAG: DUF3280 domain-containing protein [Pseudomonadota bacterium]
MRQLIAILIAVVWAGAVQADGLSPGAKIAFFGISFIDTSTEGAYNGIREDETARLAMLEGYVRDQFTERGFTLLPLDTVETEINRVASVADCNFCDVIMARKLEADYSMVGEVQKVSNLILAMNLVVRDAAEGQHVRGISVDIRGNNDKSWLRGMRYILKNNIFKE